MANSPNPQLVEMLREQLRDIQTPEPISWWPMAPGWWMLIVLGVVLSVVLFRYLRKRQREREYRNYLTDELEAIYNAWQETQNTSNYCQQANQLLKRAMLKVQTDSRNDNNTELSASSELNSISALSGSAWLESLESVHEPMSESVHNALGLYVYQANAQIEGAVDVPNLHAELTNWLSQHRRVLSSNTRSEDAETIHRTVVSGEAS